MPATGVPSSERGAVLQPAPAGFYSPLASGKHRCMQGPDALSPAGQVRTSTGRVRPRRSAALQRTCLPCRSATWERRAPARLLFSRVPRGEPRSSRRNAFLPPPRPPAPAVVFVPPQDLCFLRYLLSSAEFWITRLHGSIAPASVPIGGIRCRALGMPSQRGKQQGTATGETHRLRFFPTSRAAGCPASAGFNRALGIIGPPSYAATSPLLRVRTCPFQFLRRQHTPKSVNPPRSPETPWRGHLHLPTLRVYR